MSPEAQRIAIAEECGWTLVGRRLPRVHHGNTLVIGIAPEKAGETSEWLMREIPDYLNDLNAMYEAASVFEFQQRYEFITHLKAIMNTSFFRDVVFATAPQRAEAFLRTLGKWDGSK